MWVKTNFWTEKFGSKENYGSRKMLGFQNNVGSKNFRLTNFGPKKNSGPKNMLVSNIFVSEFFFVHITSQKKMYPNLVIKFIYLYEA